jgi:hypothetical protein
MDAAGNPLSPDTNQEFFAPDRSVLQRIFQGEPAAMSPRLLFPVLVVAALTLFAVWLAAAIRDMLKALTACGGIG